MKIPVLNIYYLLCYAWDKLDEKDIVDVSCEDDIQLLDLFALVLINGATYLFKKGLDRDYQEYDEDTRRLRGKILFGPSIKRHLFQKIQACCRFDELSHDILHNRILKATFKNLMNFQDLDKNLKEQSWNYYQRFPDVTDMKLESRHFESVKLTRNNRFYDFLLRICRLIFESTLIDEKTGKAKFSDFLRDDHQMSYVFESFVHNFFKKEQTAYGVKRDGIKWTTTAEGPFDNYLPVMETDTSLTSFDSTRKIVIETKYKKDIFHMRHGFQEKIISANLYQLFAYLKNLENKGGPNADCEGILLYASADKDVDMYFELPRHKVRVKTLNLTRPWKMIHDDLMAMISAR